MEVKLGAHVYYIFSMTTTTTNSVRHFSFNLLLHSSTVARMEVTLGAYVVYIISMTTTTTKSLSNFFFIITSSLLKLANGTTDGGVTWYAYVEHHFHDNHSV